MRRPLAALAVAASGLLTLSLVAGAATAVTGGSATTGSGSVVAGGPGHGGGSSAYAEQQAADHALAAASDALHGSAHSATTPAAHHGLPATLALRDLRLSLGHLSTDDRKRATALLARPTDGSSDPYGDGYTVPAKRKCSTHFCLHWVTSTSDKAPSQAWVDDMLALMGRVWRKEVGDLGYRQPLSDGTRGGDSRFDVYLADVGSEGLYGYCAPEKRSATNKWLYSGYCVLDNDFAKAQFGAPPMDSAKVTAAHEFFHAIQFAYDTGEDTWFMEGTATWMEERFADSVNDNRQYLPYGQVSRPGSSLDLSRAGALNVYGNWAFFEYLSHHYGISVVKRIWNDAAAFAGAPDDYSIKAVSHALKSRTTLTDLFRRYAAANTHPAAFYPEGAHWPSAAIASSYALTKAHRGTGAHTWKIDHLASSNLRITPGRSLAGAWRLKVAVDGPGSGSAPGAYVLVKKRSGRLLGYAVRLNAKGAGSVRVPFNHTHVSSVTVTLANASTRYRCWRSGAFSCQGSSRDQDRRFTLRATAVR